MENKIGMGKKKVRNKLGYKPLSLIVYNFCTLCRHVENANPSHISTFNLGLITLVCPEKELSTGFVDVVFPSYLRQYCISSH